MDIRIFSGSAPRDHTPNPSSLHRRTPAVDASAGRAASHAPAPSLPPWKPAALEACRLLPRASRWAAFSPPAYARERRPRRSTHCPWSGTGPPRPAPHGPPLRRGPPCVREELAFSAPQRRWAWRGARDFAMFSTARRSGACGHGSFWAATPCGSLTRTRARSSTLPWPTCGHRLEHRRARCPHKGRHGRLPWHTLTSWPEHGPAPDLRCTRLTRPWPPLPALLGGRA